MNGTKTVSGAIVALPNAEEAPLVNCLVDINAVQSGSGTPSPTNIRPISGFDTATIYVRGKNILNPTFTTKTENGVTFENVDKTVKIMGTASAYSFCNLNYANGVLAIPKGRPLKLAGGFSNSIYLTACYFKEGTSTTITAATSKSGEFVPFTIPEDASTSWIRVNVAAGATTDMTILPMVCADGTTDTAFKPYDARSFTKSVPLGRTVYGGTLDVVSGVLIVDRPMVDLGTLNWSLYNGKFTSALNPEPLRKAFGEINMLCSIYKTGTYGSSSSQGDGTIWLSASTSANTVYVEDSRYTDAASFKTAMSGVQLCYELATPQTYTLTGQEITPIIGQDTIWANTGEIQVTYRTSTLGIIGTIYINGRQVFKPNDFEIRREDVYAGEYTSCTGRILADKIGWKFSDMTMKWEILPDADLAYLTTLSGPFALKFRDNDGPYTETVIRRGFTNTPTRITGPEGSKIWTGVEMEVTFINVHNSF